MTVNNIGRRFRRFLPLRFKLATPTLLTNLGSLVDVPEGYFPTNPSFVDLTDGRLISIRCVNYICGEKGAPPVFTVGSNYHSVNRFILQTKESSPSHAIEWLEAAFEGAEDVRLFAHLGEAWCVYSQPTGAGRCNITIARINIDRQTVVATPLVSPYGFSQEKNWSPFSHQGEIYFVYSFSPLIILKFDPQHGKVGFVNSDLSKFDPDSFDFIIGGSGAGIKRGDGYLFAIHRRSVRLPDMRRIYVHRFAHLSSLLDKITWGPYFVIGKAEVQFVAAIGIRPDGECEMAFGRLDNQAYLARLGRDLSSSILP